MQERHRAGKRKKGDMHQKWVGPRSRETFNHEVYRNRHVQIERVRSQIKDPSTAIPNPILKGESSKSSQESQEKEEPFRNLIEW